MCMDPTSSYPGQTVSPMDRTLIRSRYWRVLPLSCLGKSSWAVCLCGFRSGVARTRTTHTLQNPLRTGPTTLRMPLSFYMLWVVRKVNRVEQKSNSVCLLRVNNLLSVIFFFILKTVFDPLESCKNITVYRKSF